MYRWESELVAALTVALSCQGNPLNSEEHAQEFYYLAGRTDIVVADTNGELVAIEAKLKRWREAMQQAYRNSLFAHYSYVALPDNAAKVALEHRHEFERRRVGLCTVGDDGITVVIPAKRNAPLQSWLTESAFEYIRGKDENV